MRITCLTFDLDDTLWECAPLIARAERVFYAYLEANYPRIAERYGHDELVAHRRAFFGRHPDMGHDFTYLRKRWLSHLAEESGYDDDLVEDGFRVFWTERNNVTLFEEVPAALEGLKRRFIVGSITNGNADIAQAGIDAYFHFEITASAAGSAKPHPRIFHAALDAAGVRPGEAVHIGDDPERDMLGAAAVGMRTVWVNAAASPWPGGPKPDAEIRRLDELRAVLQRL